MVFNRLQFAVERVVGEEEEAVKKQTAARDLVQDNLCLDSVYCMKYANRSTPFGTRPGRNEGTANASSVQKL